MVKAAFEGVPARYWSRLPDGQIECEVCPRRCRLRDGQRGLCFVRARQGDGLVLTTYGRSSGYCIDPIEKKPLNHFLPGTPVLSFGTAGCNLTCRFCQNWDISKSREIETLSDEAPPERIARAAASLGCRSVAFTYNDPVIFLEYAVDTAIACREQGIRTVAVTAGYIEPEPLAELQRHLDAANVDLKAFTETFYKKLCTAELGPVLETLEVLVNETDVWVEITTLLIPGERLGRGASRRQPVGGRQARSGRALALHRLPPGLPNARQAEDARRQPLSRSGNRNELRAPVRLHGQRARRARRQHLVPRMRRAADRPRLVRAHQLVPRPGGSLPALRDALPRGLRSAARQLGGPASARATRGLRLTITSAARGRPGPAHGAGPAEISKMRSRLRSPVDPSGSW